MKNENYEIIRDYWELKDDPLFPFNDRIIDEYPSQRELILRKRDEFFAASTRLENLTVADLKQCKRNLLKAIDTVIATATANKLGYPLARNQGLIIPNYVYGKILSVIEGAVKAPLGIGYPDFYYERGGDFDAVHLLEILRAFKGDLQNQEFPSYPDFVECFERYESEIQALWKRENERGRRRTES